MSGNPMLVRFGLKVYTAEGSTPALHDVAPIFYQWIQKQAIAGHLLIDVHDYSHVPRGPGILLVAHEGNFSLDSSDGRFGLFYNRKTSVAAGFDATLAASVRATLEACRLLETDAGLKFSTDEVLFVANDRLLAPNDAETAKRLQGEVQSGLKRLWTAGSLAIEPVAAGPKDRFALRVRMPQAEPIQDLLSRAL